MFNLMLTIAPNGCGANISGCARTHSVKRVRLSLRERLMVSLRVVYDVFVGFRVGGGSSAFSARPSRIECNAIAAAPASDRSAIPKS